jgi:multiple sugar transport system ATP-binding protein
MTLGDRIVIMKDGEVQQIGTPQEVFNKPVNTFVATFIGTPQMNMFSGKLVKNEAGKYAVRVKDAEIELSEDKQKNLADRNTAEQDVTVGIRPEHITLDGAEGTVVTGTVDVSEMMGSSIHLHVASEGTDCIIIVPTLDLGERDLSAGTEVGFTFAPNAIHVFDTETGNNLEYV